MSLFSKVVGTVLEKAVMTSGCVASVMTLGRFRLIELQAEGLKKRGGSPGDKIRVKLGGLDLRTYTPFSRDEKLGIVRFLAWLPGRGPGSKWAETVRVGESVFLMGPRESLDFSASSGEPVIFFGDETAIGAAAALRGLRIGDPDVRFILELSDPDEALVAMIALGMQDAVRVEKSLDGSHLDTVCARILEWAGARRDFRIFLVGNFDSVKTLKAKLAEKLPGAKIKVKVYWREGKPGLD